MGSRAGLDYGEGKSIVSLPGNELWYFSLQPSRYAREGENWRRLNVYLKSVLEKVL
jgi:hypothetical protein